MTAPSLAEIAFDNRFTEDLPADPLRLNETRQVHSAAYSRVQPTPVRRPELLAYSPEVARMLDLDPAVIESPEFVDVLAGNRVLPGMDPHAACYGGHQFGHWAGQLGDGRAIVLGEIATSRHGHQTLQLKGAGPTPYSRHADGLAVLRSSVREFLCSEAMHHLGVPTTRALSLVTTGEQVLRDMFYDGHPEYEPGAVVCRVAPSFIRFGNFEIFTARNDLDNLRRLADFTIRTEFPGIWPSDGEATTDHYLEWYREVVRLTAAMVVEWMRVGFVHGVMNTDNMSILGLTIDYGPYGWLDDFDPNWTPNTTDAAQRRYRFANQPGIAHWNLSRLASAIHPLVGAVEPLQEALDTFVDHYERGYGAMMAAKLGLLRFDRDTDPTLIRDLIDVLQLTETDMTIFYRSLAALPLETGVPDWPAIETALGDAYYRPDEIDADTAHRVTDWVARYARRVRTDGRSDAERAIAMNEVNPKFVMRNYLAQLAIDAAVEDDPSVIHRLLDVMRRPYDEQPEHEDLAGKRPDWARTRPGCSMLSCSS